MLRFIILLLLLLLSISMKVYPFVIKNIEVEDGLSNDKVMAMVQDEQGCIWIGTESGLNRFDGKNFTVFTKSNSDLPGNEINALLYNKETNTIWASVQKKGISIINLNTYQFTNLTAFNPIMSNEITHLSHAADGGVWITYGASGIEHYDPKTNQFTRFTPQNTQGLKLPLWASFDDGNGNLYVATRNELSIINIKERTVKNFRHDPNNTNSLPGNNVYAICFDHFNNVWVGTDQGLSLFYPATGKFTNFKYISNNPYSLIGNHVYNIKEMKDQTLWIAADIGGISILNLQDLILKDPGTIRFTNLKTTNDSDLSSGNIRSLLQDSFGNIWAGNFSGGLSFISHNPPLFQILPYIPEKEEMKKKKEVWSICMDKEQQIWLGSENEITCIGNDKKRIKYDISLYLSNPYTHVSAMFCDRTGAIWLGLYNEEGILRFDIRNNKFKRIASDHKMEILSFWEDTDGKMWMGSQRSLYSYINGKIQWEEEIARQLPQLSTVAIYGITQDKQGKLWIGTWGGGIYIFDKNNQLTTHLNENSQFCSNTVNHLFLDRQGGVWAATRNGIAYFNDTETPNRFELYGDEQGLENSHVRAIQEDLAGNIWISTHQGISMWDKQKHRFDNYNHNDGTPTGNFIEGSAVIDSNGIIYFGARNGACFFDPKQLTEKKQIAPVRIIECKSLENQNTERFIPSDNGRINLPYNQNSFRISFAVPDYSQSRQVEYAYMIQGLSNTWNSTQGENQVTFRNISPGEYTFKVKARLKNQDWDEAHITTMDIRIHPPLWLTWYAKCLYFILLCIVIYLSFRAYKRKLILKNSLELERKKSIDEKELNNERLRFYTNVTHELRTPLTLILGPLEDLLNDRNLSPDYNKKVGIIHNSAGQLLNLINQLLEFRKTETQNRKLTVSKGDLKNLVMEVGLRYKELNSNKNVAFKINIETKETRIYFDAEMITTILNNLLSNAIKYTPEGTICLSLRSVKEDDIFYTEIEVSDTGYGIDPEALPHIFERYYQAEGKHQASGSGIGLSLVKSLVDLHKGTLHVESAVGKGTTFRFRILTGNTYSNALHKEDKLINQKLEQEEENDVQPILLIVEDNKDIREYISASFHTDYKILEASNGKEGLELAGQYIPDIIISDIMMPEMNGNELCQTLKGDISTSHIPVILLTAKDSIQDKEEGYNSGADSYLTKPFSAKLLRSRILNLLESRKRLAKQIETNTRNPEPNHIQPPAELSRLDEEFLKTLTSIIEENITIEELDIDFLTKKTGMSHSTLYRKVKGLTGISPNEFIRKVKLKNSMQLLMTGKYNVSEVAYKTGFNHLSYFRLCFKNEYGMTPSEYLKQK